MLLKGWYSQNGWRTKLILINKSNRFSRLRIKLLEGENDRILAIIRIKLKPKEMRFYDLSKIKRISRKSGVILIDSDEQITCTAHLVNVNDEMKVIDYRLARVDIPEGCC